MDDQDNNNEEIRISCVTSYPAWLQSLDSAINTSHFVIPFVINMLQSIDLIRSQFLGIELIFTSETELLSLILRGRVRRVRMIFVKTPLASLLDYIS